MKKLIGSGGGDSSPKQTSDNLFSTDVVEVLLGLSEGPIKGLKNGAKSFLIGDTPLKNVDDQNNFDAFELVVRKGSELGEDITSRMGGFASSTNVGVALASTVPVVRQGLHTGIDYIDIRLAINRLYVSDSDGTFEHTGKIKIEYKKTSSPTWLPVQTDTNNPPPPVQTGVNTDVYTELTSVILTSASPGDRDAYIANSEPTPPNNSPALWFESDDNYQPHWWDGTWHTFSGASYNVPDRRWTWSETSSWGADKATNAFIRLSTETKPSNREQGDYLVLTDTSQVFFFNGSSWIFAGSSLAPGNFGSNATGGSVTVGDGEIRIKGKTSTTFIKEFRFPVDNITDDTYQIRVTKTSPENTTEKFFDVSWESFQEVVAKTYNFPALATAQLTARASEQFSSIPEFSGIYQGRIVKVPSNYDPEDRTYTGIWDGTFKLEYTNNPAYIVYDLVENDRYGLNAYYPVVLNKFDVYDAGVWCDTLTEDGQPRFTFNGLIDEPRGCREAIDYICGTFGGRFFDDGNGSAVIRIDKNDSPSGIFGPENVVDGMFTYSFTESSGRHNDITVTFINPALNYKEDRVRVFNQDHIDKYGRIPLNFVAVGCTDAKEAIVRGRYKLVTGTSEVTLVNFKTNRMGLYHQPYDIILIADEDVNAGISGRIKSINPVDWYQSSFGSVRAFELRDPIYLEPGYDYKAMFQIPEGESFTVVEVNLEPGVSGELDVIPLDGELPSLVRAGTMFTISTVTDELVPRAFRIMSISELEGDADNVEIQAIEVNRLKWDFIDGLIDDYEVPENYDLEVGGKPAPVPVVRLTSYTNLNGSVQTYNIVLDWDPSPSPTVSHYRVYMSKDNGPMAVVGDTQALTFEVTNVQPGEYIFSVVAVSDVSVITDSLPNAIEHRLIGDLADPTTVQNVRLILETSTTIYAHKDATFAWDAVTSPDHHHYTIRVLNMADVVVGEYSTVLTQFTYDYLLNTTDNGTPQRQFKFAVASQDQFGNNSDFNILTVNNPQPLPPSPVITPGVGSFSFQFPVAAIPDYAGVMIWVGTTPGFTPGPGNLVYDGVNNSYVHLAAGDTTYYIRYTVYDTFDKLGTTLSPEYSVTTGSVVGDINAEFEAIPGYLFDIGEGTLSQKFEKFYDMIHDLGNQSVTSQLVSNQIRTELTAELGNSKANFLQQITVVADSVSALASDVTALEVAVGDGTAGIITDLNALATEVDAQATALTEVAAQVGDATAQGLWKIETAVAPVGITARFSVLVRVSDGDAYEESGLMIDIIPDGIGGYYSRVAIKTDQFVVTDGTNTVNAMTFEDGVLKLNVARVGRIESSDGVSYIDLGPEPELHFESST